MSRFLAVTGAVAAAISLASCGSGDPDASEVAPGTATVDTRDTTAPPAAATTTSAAASFPLDVTADNGPVTIDARPQRIVSLSASLTEMLYAVGAGDQVVAVDEHSNFPGGTPVTDLSGFSPNIEAITTFTPDLVVVANDRDGIIAALDTVGIPALLLERASAVDDTYDQLRVLGSATGHEAQADTVVEQMGDDIAEIVATVPEREAPLTYFYELSADGYSATSDTFIGGVLALAGLESIADGVDDAAGGFPQLSAEYVLAQNPDLVFLAHTDGVVPTADELAARPGWNDLDAMMQGRVIGLDPDVASRWGPRIVDLLAVVVDATASIQ